MFWTGPYIVWFAYVPHVSWQLYSRSCQKINFSMKAVTVELHVMWWTGLSVCKVCVAFFCDDVKVYDHRGETRRSSQTYWICDSPSSMNDKLMHLSISLFVAQLSFLQPIKLLKWMKAYLYQSFHRWRHWHHPHETHIFFIYRHWITSSFKRCFRLDVLRHW